MLDLLKKNLNLTCILEKTISKKKQLYSTDTNLHCDSYNLDFNHRVTFSRPCRAMSRKSNNIVSLINNSLPFILKTISGKVADTPVHIKEDEYYNYTQQLTNLPVLTSVSSEIVASIQQTEIPVGQWLSCKIKRQL